MQRGFIPCLYHSAPDAKWVQRMLKGLCSECGMVSTTVDRHCSYCEMVSLFVDKGLHYLPNGVAVHSQGFAPSVAASTAEFLLFVR